MLSKYATSIIGIVLAIATATGVAYAAQDHSDRAADGPGSASSTVVPYGSR